MIIYFTGTGNSLAAARRIADRTGDRAVPLRAVRDADLVAERRIGIVFPVYCFDAPPPGFPQEPPVSPCLAPQAG